VTGGFCTSNEPRQAEVPVNACLEADLHTLFRKICLIVEAWCLWCLFGGEIGAIYAEQLKELKQVRP